jgi:phage major head subunit gpT-like protein
MPVNADINTALATINTAVIRATDEFFNGTIAGNFQLYTAQKTGSKLSMVGALGPSPRLRKWQGAKVIKRPRAYTKTFETVNLEATMGFRKDEVTQDVTGLVAARISGFLESMALELNRISFEALIANGTGLDGVALFVATHPWATEAGGTQGNLSANALTLANYVTARTAGMSLTDESGRSLNVVYDTIVVGPKNVQKAREMFNAANRLAFTTAAGAEATSSVINSGTLPNVWDGELKVVEEPQLIGTYDDYWYLLDTKRGGDNKPIWLMESDPLHVVALDRETDTQRFWNNDYVWSVEGSLVADSYNWTAAYANIL